MEKSRKTPNQSCAAKTGFWRGWLTKGKTQISRFDLNFPSGVHFIELWADRTPMLGSLELEVGGERTGVGGYKNRDLGWWKKSKPVKAYTYPPEEPLDPNLVKAMIFKRAGLAMILMANLI